MQRVIDRLPCKKSESNVFGLRRNASGFTILELMIATTVLSVLLLLATVTIIGVGHLYYKGQVTARTLDANRAVVEDISRQLQFSGDKPNLAPPASWASVSCSSSIWCATVNNPSGGTSTVYAYCLGTTRFSFVLNQKLVDGTTHVLWEDTLPGGTASCTPLDVLASPVPTTATNPATVAGLPGSGRELLLPNMRLTGFGLRPNADASLYHLTLNVAYGDDDLFGAISGTVPVQHRSCNTAAGDQFCAVSEIQTSITRRLR